MKIICSKEDLHMGINVVQKAVSTKSTLQILEGILVEAGDTLKLTGNDLEIGIEATVNANIIEQGSFVVNSKIIGEIVRKLPDSEISMVYNNEEAILNIESGNSHFRIRTMSPEGFPALPEVRKENSFAINRIILKDMIRQTIFSVGTDEYRPILTGVLIEYKDGELNFVSLDGFRIAKRSLEIEANIENFNLVVPGKTLNEISKVLQAQEGNVYIYNSNNQILFDAGSFKVVSRLLEGEFFNYRSAIPNDYETKITVDTHELMSSIERASLMTTGEQEKNYPVDFNIADDKLIVTSNTTKGSVREEIRLEMEGSDLKISFNPAYFIDALRVIDEKKVNILFRSIGACTITPIEGNEFVYMILPLLK